MSFLKILTFSALASLSLIFTVSESQAQDLQTPDLACDIIHNYENYCGNLDPDTCVRYRQGFDYWGNEEHRRIWDNYYNLCGQDVTRTSHECVEYLGIASQCIPSVEAPPEPVNVYRAPHQYQLAPAPREEVVAYSPPATHSQVCCQVPQTPAEPAAAPPVAEPAQPAQPANPVVDNPAPQGNPIEAPADAVDEGDSNPAPEAVTDHGASQDTISGELPNGIGGTFQMSGTGCSIQGSMDSNFDAGPWALLAILALFGMSRGKASILR